MQNPFRHAAAALGAALLLTTTGCGKDADPTDPQPQVERTLTVEVAGIGVGAVTSDPAGIDCGDGGTACSASFDHGTAVTVTSAPATRMAFGGWSGACTGSGACAVTMDADRTLGASFANPHLVSAQIGPAGGEIVSSDGSLTLTFPAGALTATETITLLVLDTAGAGAQIGDGFDVDFAVEMGPSGLAFLQPVVAEILSERAPLVQGDTVSVVPEVLFTVSGGTVAGLDNAEAMVDPAAGEILLRGELTHFSAIYRASFYKPGETGPVQFLVAGVPDEAEVGTNYDILFNILPGPWAGTATRIDDASIAFEPANGASSFGEMILTEGPMIVEYACDAVRETAYFAVTAHVHTQVSFSFEDAGDPTTAPHLYFAHIHETLPCVAPAGPPTLTTGMHPAPAGLEQTRGAVFTGTTLAGVETELGVMVFSGGGTGDAEGAVVAWDLYDQQIVFTRDVPYYAWAVAVAQSATDELVAGLFVLGDGHAIFPADGDFAEDPVDVRTDITVDQATHAGGGGPGDAIAFASADLGVGFVFFDPDSGRFAVSDEVLDAGDFVGDVRSVYIDAADGPALVLDRASNSRLYLAARDGNAPAVVADGLGTPNGMRCLPPICLVFPNTGSATMVFTFDGQNPPSRVPDAEVGFIPIDAALLHLPGGNVAALVIGGAFATEIEFDTDGAVVRSEAVEIPQECHEGFGNALGAAAYVPDGAGVAGVLTCWRANAYLVVRSALFPAP